MVAAFLTACPGSRHTAPDGLICPMVGCASIACLQWRSGDFLPLPLTRHSSRDNKVSGPSSFASLRPQAVRRDRLGL
jgi:hypothetical protein